jgi:hypothetical protein
MVRRRFSPKVVLVGCLLNKVTLGQVLLRVLRSPIASHHRNSVLYLFVTAPVVYDGPQQLARCHNLGSHFGHHLRPGNRLG